MTEITELQHLTDRAGAAGSTDEKNKLVDIKVGAKSPSPSCRGARTRMTLMKKTGSGEALLFGAGETQVAKFVFPCFK